eukprot:4691583-Ditylum_brightwellii.AAC.1
MNGIPGHEASMVLKQVSCNQAEKWDYTFSQASNYVKTMISLFTIAVLVDQECHHWQWALIPFHARIVQG